MPGIRTQAPEIPRRIERLGLRIVRIISRLDDKFSLLTGLDLVFRPANAPHSPRPPPRTLRLVLVQLCLLPSLTSIRGDVYSDYGSASTAEREALNSGLVIAVRFKNVGDDTLYRSLLDRLSFIPVVSSHL